MYKGMWHPVGACCILLLTCSRQSALAFLYIPTNYIGHQSSARTSMPPQYTSPDLEGFISESNGLSSSFGNNSLGTELWLDLRSTALHPRAAIEYLESQLDSEPSTNFVDRVLLSPQAFQNLVDDSDPSLGKIRYLYQSSDGESIVSSPLDGDTHPFGCIVPFPNDISLMVEDPIQAMQIISNGKWFVLGKEGENVDYQQETNRLDAVGPFLDIAYAASGAGMWDESVKTNGGLMLRTKRPLGGSSSDKEDNLGGVAIKCYTTSALMKLASALRLIQPGSQTSITNGGIVLQSSDGSSTSSISTAIILHFDVELWESAVLMFGEEDSLNLED